MVPSDISTPPAETQSPEAVHQKSLQNHKRFWQRVNIPHRIMWICLLLASVGASWFSYQYFLVPQPASFAPDWQGAQWIQAADGNAPVAYFRYSTSLNSLPDSAFVTIAASQIFRLYVNGSFVGSNAVDFTQGNFPRAYIYDVTSSLKAGPNVIALRVANVDERKPSVRAILDTVQGRSIYYHGTDSEWQATTQSSLVYSRYAGKSNPWTKTDYDASSWLPVQKITDPPVEAMLTVNPQIYERPISTYWLSAGASHDGYFVRQFSLPLGISGAWVRLAATGTASVFINGNLFMVWNGQAPVPQQNLADYLSDNETLVQYRSGLALGIYDISSYLHPGVNTIAVHVTSPGVSAAQVGLDNLNAAMSVDMLTNNFQGQVGWLTPDIGWHASPQPVDGWAQASSAALNWSPPISTGRPGASRGFYLPDTITPRNVQLIPLSLVAEVILFSTGAVIGIWLLMSLVFSRRYYRTPREALETMSMAYLPALALEGLLVSLSRESQMPRPFPYTWIWGLVLIIVVGITYLLLCLNARTVNKQRYATISGKAERDVSFLAPIAPLREGLLKLYHGSPSRRAPGAQKAHPDLWERTLAWGRTHWALILIVLLAIPLISYNISYEPYWQDELTSYYAAKGILAHGFPVLPSGFLYPKGELFSYVLAFSMVIFGDQGGAPRIVSALEYLVSLPLLYFVGSYFFDRRVALLATAMLALSPIALIWGRQVRMYEQAQVVTLLVVYLFYKALQERARVRWVYIAVGCLLLGYLSHEETFISFPALVVCVLIASRDAKHRLPAILYQKHWWFAAIIGISVIALQLVIVNVSHPPILGTDASQRPFIQPNLNNVPYYANLLFSQLKGEPYIGINSILAVAGCIWARRSTDLRVKYCALFLLISFFTLALVFTMRADRYFYPLLPIYYLMGAYAMLTGLNAMWTFAYSRILLPQPSRSATSSLSSYLSRPMKVMMMLTVGLLCVSLLIVPILPLSGYNLFISRIVGFSYHRHYADYDDTGQYMEQHWRKGDIVICVAPDFSVYYYSGHADYFFSIDRALFLFERDGHIVDTSLGGRAILNQDDFQSVLASHSRVWIVSDNGSYQSGITKNGRFIFPPDFHIVYEGYGSAIYSRG